MQKSFKWLQCNCTKKILHVKALVNIKAEKNILGTQACNKCATIKNYGMTLWAEFITLRIATFVEHTILNSHIP